MSKIELKDPAFELRLGAKLIACFAGVITALVVCAYYLGLIAGRSIGFESALRDSASQLARIPFDPSVPQEGNWDREMQSTAQDIFARLNSEKLTPKKEDPKQGVQVGEMLANRSVTLPNEEGLSDEKAKNIEKAGIDKALASKNGVGADMQLGTDSKPDQPTKSAQVKVFGRTFEKGDEEGAERRAIDTARLPVGYFVQVASSANMKDLEPLSRKLKASGFPVVVEEHGARTGRIFRILVGPEETSKTASRLAAQVARESYVNGKPFLRSVK
jgi:cell division septation protein DedD